MNPHKLYAKLGVRKQAHKCLFLDRVLPILPIIIGVCEPRNVKNHGANGLKGLFWLKLCDSHFQEFCLFKNSCTNSNGKKLCLVAWVLKDFSQKLKLWAQQHSRDLIPKMHSGLFPSAVCPSGSSLCPGTVIPPHACYWSKSWPVCPGTVYFAMSQGKEIVPPTS